MIKTFSSLSLAAGLVVGMTVGSGAATVADQLGIYQDSISPSNAQTFYSSLGYDKFLQAFNIAVTDPTVGLSGIKSSLDNFGKSWESPDPFSIANKVTILGNGNWFQVVDFSNTAHPGVGQINSVPGPIVGAGLPALFGLVGAAWAIRRRKTV